MSLRSTFPGYSQEGQSQQQLAAVLYGIDADLGFTVPLAVTVGPNFDSAILVLPGLNSFMCETEPTGGGGTYTIAWVHCDPITPAQELFTRQIATGVSPAANALFTFGAFGLTAPSTNGDVFHTGKLRFTAATATVTFNHIRLWAGKR